MTNAHKVTDIAYKKVSKDQSNQGWGNLKDEVLTLRARKHSNITPLLASFVAGLEKPSTPNPAEPQECLYMISPLAAMDMSTWLKDGHNSCADMVNHQFRDLIYSDAMLGLIRGVTYIHREIKGDVGYHRDLKPKNVLLFPRNSGWIWKICDFGCANLKPAMETGTYNFTTTHYWAPPEYFTDRDRTDAQTHGRPHDVWSLGCMFLELATMAQYGWDNGGLQEFKMKRAQCKDSTPGYNQARQDQDQSAFHSSESAVRDWISHLEEKAAARQQAKLVLRIIREMLLPRKERISAWEVNVYLFQAIDPERTESEVLDELRKVIQKSRAVDLEMKQTPMTRANKWQQSHEFCQILSEKGWLDYSPQMTTEHRKRAKAVQSYHSTLPELTENAALFGCQHIVADIFERFGHTDTLALSGMGGVG
jgi:serine/threonine protein kinase